MNSGIGLCAMGNRIKPKNEFYRDNKKGLIKKVKEEIQVLVKGDILFLKGQTEIPNYDDDGLSFPSVDNLFVYLLGVHELGCYAIVELTNGRTTLFVPREPENAHYWKKIMEPVDFMKKYEFEEALYCDQIENWFSNYYRKENTVYIYKGYNPFSKIEFLNPLRDFNELLNGKKINIDKMLSLVSGARERKSETEIALI